MLILKNLLRSDCVMLYFSRKPQRFSVEHGNPEFDFEMSGEPQNENVM